MTRRRMIWGVALALVLAAAGAAAWTALVRVGVLRYNKWDRREWGTLKVGDPAPDVQLSRYEGSPLRLASLWADTPVFIVFGSCT